MSNKSISIIAVDFDGTLCLDKYPGVDCLVQEAIDVLQDFRSRGGEVVLWSCRHGFPLSQAVVALKEAGLEFDAVNANSPKSLRDWEQCSGYPIFDSDQRKVYADLYIDDKESSLFGERLDWAKIREYLAPFPLDEG